MKNKLLSLFLILFTFFIVACSKDKIECSSTNTVNIPQVMKDFFFYKEGTWWVYKNVKDNTFDSMWVRQSSSNAYRGESDGFGNINKCYEHTVMGIDNIGTKGFMRWIYPMLYWVTIIGLCLQFIGEIHQLR